MKRWVGFGIFLALFICAWYLVDTGRMDAFDAKVQGFFFALRDWENIAVVTKVFRIITVFGGSKVIAVICAAFAGIPFLLLLAFGLRPREEQNRAALRGLKGFFFGLGLPIALATGIGGVVHEVLKQVAGRARPDAALWLIEEDGFSFPSGHSNVSVILYLFLAVLLGRMLMARGHDDAAFVVRNLFVVLVLLIGLSRIYLGVHYPSDVLGGFALGGALLNLFLFLYDGPYARRRPEALPPPEPFDDEDFDEDEDEE